MRKAVNENPVVQIVLVGVLGIFVAFLLFTRVMNRDSGGEAAPATSAPSSEASAAGVAATTPAATAGPASGAPAAGSAPSTAAPAPTAPSTAPAPAPVSAAGFEAGPGLPKPVVSAYEDGKAVVLLVSKQRGIDDRAIRGSVEALRGRGDTAVFLVPAKNVARYARITEGVQLDRAPAIVVLRPRRLSGPIPEATVSYGFRGPESVEQAVEDALFDGKAVTYDP